MIVFYGNTVHASVPGASYRLSVPIVGGNCNNGSKCGRYLNVNNAVSNTNWNIGASLCLSLHIKDSGAQGRVPTM